MTYNLRINFKDGSSEYIFGLTQEEAEASKDSFERAIACCPHGHDNCERFWTVRANGEKHYFDTNFVKSLRVIER